jgi:hypothetical protein
MKRRYVFFIVAAFAATALTFIGCDNFIVPPTDGDGGAPSPLSFKKTTWKVLWLIVPKIDATT